MGGIADAPHPIQLSHSHTTGFAMTEPRRSRRQGPHPEARSEAKPRRMLQQSQRLVRDAGQTHGREVCAMGGADWIGPRGSPFPLLRTRNLFAQAFLKSSHSRTPKSVNPIAPCGGEL